MTHRLPALAAALALSFFASALPGPAVADARPKASKTDKPHKGTARADGRKNH